MDGGSPTTHCPSAQVEARLLPNLRFVGLGSNDAEGALAPQVGFVANWFEELKRLVPTE